MAADISDAVKYAALVALHKQLRSVAEVRLTPEDFAWPEMNYTDAIQLSYEPDGDVIVLRHVKKRSDA